MRLSRLKIVSNLKLGAEFNELVALLSNPILVRHSAFLHSILGLRGVSQAEKVPSSAGLGRGMAKKVSWITPETVDNHPKAAFLLKETFHTNPKSAVAWFQSDPWLQSGESLPLNQLVDICLYLSLTFREAEGVIASRGKKQSNLPAYIEMSKVTKGHRDTLLRACTDMASWLSTTFLSNGRSKRCVSVMLSRINLTCF